MKAVGQCRLFVFALFAGAVCLLVVRHYAGLKIYARVFRRLGSEWSQEGKRGAAEKYLKRAITMDPADPKSYVCLAEHYFRVGWTDLTVQTARQALQRNPKCPGAFFLLGQAQYAQGRVKEARVNYRKAIRYAGNLGQLGRYHYHMGEAFLMLEDKFNVNKQISTLRKLDQKAYALKLQKKAQEWGKTAPD